MTKNNNSLLEKMLESDWKYSAKLAAITYVMAFWALPWVLPSVFLPLVQFLAKWIVGGCIVISFFKTLQGSNKYKQTDLDSDVLIAAGYSSEKRETSEEKNSLFNNLSEHEHEHEHEDEDEDEDEDEVGNQKTITPIEQSGNVKPEWTLAFINSLDWHVFETLCSKYLHAEGIKNNETDLGADGGVDLVIYETDQSEPTAIAQCKKWSNPIKVGLLREFYGVMSQYKVTKGYFFTTNKFYKTSIKFADENGVDLIDGALLISLLKDLELEQQEQIYKSITTGDYTTPTCVRCGEKMVKRINGKTKKYFWGCNTYRCTSTLNIKSKSKSKASNKSSLL